MSEYMEIETEIEDDDLTMHIHTNLKLADGAPEAYGSLDAMEEGSPVAQTLAMIDGIVHLTIDGKNMVLVRDLDVPWHSLVSDISSALKDFFL